MQKKLLVACALAATAMALPAAFAASGSQVQIAEERAAPMPLADLKTAQADQVTSVFIVSGGGKLDVIAVQDLPTMEPGTLRKAVYSMPVDADPEKVGFHLRL